MWKSKIFLFRLVLIHSWIVNELKNATQMNRMVSNNPSDQANKAKLILLLGGFNNTGEFESQLKRISMPPSSSEPLHALMIMECHQNSYTLQWISFDIYKHRAWVWIVFCCCVRPVSSWSCFQGVNCVWANGIDCGFSLLPQNPMQEQKVLLETAWLQTFHHGQYLVL